jgi:ubiquinone/menaquinone biosynthesis C-methylase UbiE
MGMLPPDFRIWQDKFSKPGLIASMLMKRYFKCVASFIGENRSGTVCDVGCGEGVPLAILAPLLENTEISGIDLSESNIECIRENIPRGTFLQGSAYEIPFEDSSFDLVLCLEVLEHLDTPEKALGEIQRISADELIFGVPNEPVWSIANMLRLKYLSSWGNTPDHCQKWSSKGFTKLVSGYFDVIQTVKVFPWTLIHAKKV